MNTRWWCWVRKISYASSQESDAVLAKARIIRSTRHKLACRPRDDVGSGMDTVGEEKRVLFSRHGSPGSTPWSLACQHVLLYTRVKKVSASQQKSDSVLVL